MNELQVKFFTEFRTGLNQLDDSTPGLGAKSFRDIYLLCVSLITDSTCVDSLYKDTIVKSEKAYRDNNTVKKPKMAACLDNVQKDTKDESTTTTK